MTAPRELLETERARAAAQVGELSRDLDGIIQASAGANADDEHDPEGATVAFERAQVTALLAAARARLDELDRAVARLGDGKYGRCERCGEPIAAERLAARPAATTCVRCASARRD